MGYYTPLLGTIPLTLQEIAFIQNLASEAGYDSAVIPIVSSGSGAPATTPGAIGEIYIDTTGDDVYVAVGTASSADWLQVNGGGGGASWGSITGTLSDQTDLQTALDSKQAIPVVISGSLTAANDTRYINVATATYTDPSPVEGKGFIVFVRNGTATVGGTGYSTAGTIIHRIFHSGAWANYVYQVSSTFLTSASLNNTILTGTTDAERINYDSAVGTVSALGNLGATETFNWSTAASFTGTLDQNITIDFSNAVSGQRITLYLAYDGTAQRTLAFTPTIKWLGGTAPTGPDAAGEVLVLTITYIGTTYYGSAEIAS